MENIAAFAATARASDSTATSVTMGVLPIWRKPNLRSCTSVITRRIPPRSSSASISPTGALARRFRTRLNRGGEEDLGSQA